MDSQQQAELRRDIERTRAELGQSVEALAHKADVKAQARERVDEARTRAQARAYELQQRLPEQARERPAVPVAAGALGAALVALWLVRRR